MRASLFSHHKPKWLQAFLLIAFLLGTFGVNLPVVHAIYPEYLHKGRTYDQERDYIEWHGSVNYVNLYHRDNTSKPASEGGASCAKGCTEQVTRIHDGASISGNFTFLEGFSVQAAYSGNSNVGRVIVKACGKTVFNQDLYTPGASVPGFNNLPAPEWSVPTSGDCTWSITASGGYVDVRAVDATPRTATAPPVGRSENQRQRRPGRPDRAGQPHLELDQLEGRRLHRQWGLVREQSHQRFGNCQQSRLWQLHLYPDLHELGRKRQRYRGGQRVWLARCRREGKRPGWAAGADRAGRLHPQLDQQQCRSLPGRGQPERPGRVGWLAGFQRRFAGRLYLHHSLHEFSRGGGA